MTTKEGIANHIQRDKGILTCHRFGDEAQAAGWILCLLEIDVGQIKLDAQDSGQVPEVDQVKFKQRSVRRMPSFCWVSRAISSCCRVISFSSRSRSLKLRRVPAIFFL